MDLSKSKYLTGKNAKGEKITMKLEDCQFENRDAMVEAMRDKRYAADPEFRALVGVMLQRPFADDVTRQATQADRGVATTGPKQVVDQMTSTPASGPVDGRTLARALSDPAGARRQELDAVNRENFQAMFTKKDENGNLLYDRSAAYRETVRQFLIDNSAAIEAQMPAGTLVDRNQPQHRQAIRVTFGEGENSNLFNEIKQSLRDKEDAAEKERIAEQHQRVDAGESTDVRDLGGKSV